MAGSGRGKLLLNFQEVSAAESSNLSGEQALKDSGNETMTTVPGAQQQRLARDKTINDLSSSLSSFSISGGRGRSKLLDSLKSSDSSKDQIGTQSDTGSKAQPTTTISFETSSSSLKEDKSTTQDDPSLFCPPNVYGKKGAPVQLACNYLKLKSDPEKGVYVYEVRFTPSVDSIALRVKYLNEHKPKLGGTSTFDGQTLFLPILLQQKLTTFVSKDLTAQTDIEVRILYKKKESLKNCMQLYNILFDRVMKALNYVRFDRKQFDPSLPKIIPMAKLEVWPGYVTAIDEYDGGLMLCCDVSHRILCQKTVLEMLKEIYQHDPRDFHNNAKKSLLGSIVITRYNNRTYRIDDICFDQNPMSTFETGSTQTNYADYYRKHHNIQIRDLKQPLLISIKKQRGNDQPGADMVFCLIPELCHMTGIREDMRSNFKLMKEIATFTRVSPNQRLLALQKLCNNVNNSPEAKQILQNWGLSLDMSYEKALGRKFDQENIFFANRSCSAGPNADFSRDVVNNELLHIIPLKNWILMHCKKDSKIATDFVDMMMRNTRSFGMEVLRPKTITLDNDRVETYVQALRKNIDGNQQIVVCICPTIRDDRYSAIKKMCCAEMPIASQVINAKTLANESKNRSIVQKIALQMNCKMGGSLWAVKIPFKNVMICGIDSYHDASQKGNSVSAFVASLDATYTKWFSKAVIQTKKEELVNGLCASFKSALEAYNKVNGKYPENVIIYRDGVGDGQLKLCSLYEIPQFEAACSKTVKITFIVIQKRINCRYFNFNGSNMDNPLPGTVVDNHITRKNMYDFFLVSQSVRQGTVSPTHFVVLRDDANHGPDIIQRLSYKLCFLYYNWPGTVRIPACCQYAHKMAYLVGQNIQREVADELSTKLFYL